MGDKIEVDFDTFDETNAPDMKCYLTMYNGEKPLNDITQVPVALKKDGNQNTEMDCVGENKVIIPSGLNYQILTLQWKLIQGGSAYHYCSDLYVIEGTQNQKFFSKSNAQEYLDDIENFKGKKDYSFLWVFVILFGLLLLGAIGWCLYFCCRKRVVTHLIIDRRGSARFERCKESRSLLPRSGVF